MTTNQPVAEQQKKMTKETGQFNTNWRKASYFMECLNKVALATNGFPYKEIWQSVFDDHTWEERETLIKKKKSSETKRQAKFKAEGLKKPKNALNRFRTEFRNQCKTAGDNYTNDSFLTAFKQLSDADRQRLETEYRTEMAAYDTQYAALKQRAIEQGEIDEDKPKSFKSSYMVFAEECRKPDTTLLNAEEKAQLQTLPVKEQSKVFATAFNRLKTDAAVMAPINARVEQDKARFKQEEHAWKIRCLERKVAKATREGGDTASLATELETVRASPPPASTTVAKPDVSAAPTTTTTVVVNVTASADTAKKARAPRATKAKAAPVPEPDDA
jgi:hypothetical protein